METLTSTSVYAGPRLSVRNDTVRRADGSTGTWCVVEAPDIVLVVPVEGDRLHLVEQYRHPVEGRRWELPSGSVAAGVDSTPRSAAARELREEAGLTADSLTLLGTLEMSPSTLTQRCHVYLATGLTGGAPARDPEEEDMRSAWFSRAEVEQMIRDGGLTDAKSTAAYALLLLHGPTPDG